MKQIKKWVLLALCVAACLFSLSACSKEADKADGIEPLMEANLQEQTVLLLENVAVLPADQLEVLIEQNRAAGAEGVALGLESYVSLFDDLGAYQSSGQGQVKATERGYEVTVNAVFAKRACAFILNVDGETMDIISLAFEPEYTLGENMSKAFMNMVMGMGTVFVVLIFISWLISCFKYIGNFEKKSKQAAAPAPAPRAVAAPAAPAPVAEEDLTDDLELVAVITAAIAAATGTPSNGLAVRSIRRRPGNQWKRA